MDGWVAYLRVGCGHASRGAGICAVHDVGGIWDGGADVDAAEAALLWRGRGLHFALDSDPDTYNAFTTSAAASASFTAASCRR